MSNDGYHKQFPIVVNNFEDLEELLIMKLLEYRNDPSFNFDQNIKIVRCLLDRSNIFSDPVDGVSNGADFIEKAVINNDIELCKILFDLGAKFNFTKDYHNIYQPHGLFSLFSYVGSPEMIKLLLDYGVEMTKDDINVNKFLKEYLEEYKRVQQRLSLVRALETFGTDFDTIRKLGKTYTKYQKGKGKSNKKKEKTKRKVNS